ncbi:hypothetical protein SAZ10_00490 [Mesorhizobium sp. BAC0120]|uniref:hypothetical protein n=1 Tax=Mesorhizobium sp. BAC0120 TaxID=3090670 RepID=UPI00298D5D4D|nr:hypothetical protein [Mesorhizobium sp. BAC0120]MDW6020233.1 hypothetical protein [Mesorhizobium sp. BAC0120]
MGNSINTSQGKGSATNQSTGMPAWGQVGSDAYKNMNSYLKTAPMAAATQTFAQGGVGQAGQNAINQLGNMGGSNNWMNQAANSFQNVGQISEDPYRQMMGQAGQPGAAEQYLTGYARGDYLNGSPQLDNIINQTNQKTADQVNQMFAAGGRLGSGTNQGVLADSIAQNTSNLLYNNYNQQQQNQLNATNALESAQQGRMGLSLNAASGLAGVQGQNIGNQLGAAGQLGSLGQSAFGNQMQSLLGAAGLENQGFQNMLGMIGQLPTIQNNKVFDANQQMGIGNQLDTKTQNQLNELINQWTQSDMEPWARLGGLLSAGVNSAGSWGTQTSKATQPINVLGALGSLLTAPISGGTSLLGMMFK